MKLLSNRKIIYTLAFLFFNLAWAPAHAVDIGSLVVGAVDIPERGANGKQYIFLADGRYARYTKIGRKPSDYYPIGEMDPGYPKSSTAWGLSSNQALNISAVFRWDDRKDRVYFTFKDGTYMRYSLSKGSMEFTVPKSIRGNWGGGITDEQAKKIAGIWTVGDRSKESASKYVVLNDGTLLQYFYNIGGSINRFEVTLLGDDKVKDRWFYGAYNISKAHSKKVAAGLRIRGEGVKGLYFFYKDGKYHRYQYGADAQVLDEKGNPKGFGWDGTDNDTAAHWLKNANTIKIKLKTYPNTKVGSAHLKPGSTANFKLHIWGAKRGMQDSVVIHTDGRNQIVGHTKWGIFNSSLNKSNKNTFEAGKTSYIFYRGGGANPTPQTMGLISTLNLTRGSDAPAQSSWVPKEITVWDAVGGKGTFTNGKPWEFQLHHNETNEFQFANNKIKAAGAKVSITGLSSPYLKYDLVDPPERTLVITDLENLEYLDSIVKVTDNLLGRNDDTTTTTYRYNRAKSLVIGETITYGQEYDAGVAVEFKAQSDGVANVGFKASKQLNVHFNTNQTKLVENLTQRGETLEAEMTITKTTGPRPQGVVTFNVCPVTIEYRHGIARDISANQQARIAWGPKIKGNDCSGNQINESYPNSLCVQMGMQQINYIRAFHSTGTFFNKLAFQNAVEKFRQQNLIKEPVWEELVSDSTLNLDGVELNDNWLTAWANVNGDCEGQI